MKLQTLPLASLVARPGRHAPERVEVLAAQIRGGVLMYPPVVEPRDAETWFIMAGHRRVAAMLMLRQVEAPCLVVSPHDEPDAYDCARLGAQGAGAPWEVCETAHRLSERGYTLPDIAALLGRSRGYAASVCRVRRGLVPEAWERFKALGRGAKLGQFIRLSSRPSRVQRYELFGESYLPPPRTPLVPPAGSRPTPPAKARKAG